MRTNIFLMIAVGCFNLLPGEVQAQKAAPKPIFRSDVITVATPAHSVKVDVEIRGLKQLYLVVEDGDNGFSHDWASWGDPQLVGPKGKLSLGELKPIVATAGYGSVQMNKNCGGEPIRIKGRAFPQGIGTHANSVVGFNVPEGYERFTAIAGLDEGGTSQGGGDNASVRFSVYSSAPAVGSNAIVDRAPEKAIEKLDIADGLQATLFAAEPALLSLTNLDVDHRGRVWVCEVVNYRGHNGKRPEGDRILICTDTNGDGVADETKVYYQGRDIDSVMGICVLGNRVIVSSSPNIWIFTDENGDDRPDRKELLFSRTGSAQHDHSAHSFVFGPDGKLYWNFGNEGHSVHDAAGNLLKDKWGREVTDRGQPYRGGMVFRCNLDGSELEVLGHNFRNNYEAAVDSFGGIWQSDNDDDGNRGVRINFVMEYGNYGYLDEFTGAGWQSPRTGIENEIPRRHWHQDDPGVVPNLLVTGAGSPTGITVYEGTLLPERFHNQVIHCDAGPNVVRSYATKSTGAGYEVTEVNNVMLGARDNWFRPADVAVAPDGSLFVTDWYDPGVGGHAMGDLERGRLFRVAPPGVAYQVPKFDLSRPETATEALKNPCQSVRYLAWQALQGFREKAVPALEEMAGDTNARYRARALWLLAQLETKRESALTHAANDPDENIRCQSIRMARQQPENVRKAIRQFTPNATPAVNRERAIALREYQGTDFAELWTNLAVDYDGKDRWYLEALGIAADGRWNECLKSWLERVGKDWSSEAGINLIWRSRADNTPALIADLLAQPQLDSVTALRLFRSLDFQNPDKRNGALRALAANFEKRAQNYQPPAPQLLLELAYRIPAFDQLDSPNLRKSLVDYANDSLGEAEFVDAASRLRLKEFASRLLATVLKTGDRNRAASATRSLIAIGEQDRLSQHLSEAPEAEQLKIVNGWNWSGASEARQQLQGVVENKALSLLVRSEAIKALGQWPEGQKFVLQQVSIGELETDLRFPAANILLTSNDESIRVEAQKYVTLPRSADN
ncbi:MAG: PVC-type heme-binding CxxCH protein, partial [Pirellulaceae bacterium]